MTKQEQSAKVLFRVPSEDGGADVETLWAVNLGDDKYQLDNSPFYAYSISLKDVIYAPFNEDEGFPTFECVVEKSGHKTIRIILDPPVEDGNESDKYLNKLVELGCSYEGAGPSYICVDIPPEIELDTIRQYLIESDMDWEHADPCYEELFPDG